MANRKRQGREIQQDICRFSLVWMNNFLNPNLHGYLLTDENFEMDCLSFGFSEERGMKWLGQYDTKNDSRMAQALATMTDVQLLGSVIYLYWKSYARKQECLWEITQQDARQWFVTALTRLAVLTGARISETPIVNCSATYPVWEHYKIS